MIFMDVREEKKYFKRELDDALRKRDSLIYYTLCKGLNVLPKDRDLYERGRGQSEIIKLALRNLKGEEK